MEYITNSMEVRDIGGTDKEGGQRVEGGTDLVVEALKGLVERDEG